MWKPRVISSLLLIASVSILLLAAAWTMAQPISPELTRQTGEGTHLAPSQGDGVMDPARSSTQAADPNWRTWVNGVAGSQGMDVTSETSDTIEIVNVVTTLPSESIELVETWTPGELKLVGLQIQPAGSAHTVEIGRVTWQVPEGETKVYTLTKWFHVEPCTWTDTVLTETLSVAGQITEQRLVGVSKVPSALWIESDHAPVVWAGDVAMVTLRYGNAGGYENAVWIRANLPPEAPFAWSDPPPDAIDPNRLTARWNVGDLAQDSAGGIQVAIAVSENVPPPPSLDVPARIFDHVNVVRDVVTSTFTVEASVHEVVWEKTVNGQPWNPDLVVTTQTSETIVVQDLVSSGSAFILSETWNPEHLSLVDSEAPLGDVVTGTGRLEWAVREGSGEVLLTKVFHVEPGLWDWTVLEEVLEVDGAPSVRLVPVRQRPITFPEGDWPWYAQEEIAVNPEPPVAGRPTELCAEVANRDFEQGHPVLMEFAAASFGIGLPFAPVGHAEVWVPPGGRATGCTVWVPPTGDHWCIEVRLIEEGQPYVTSQRNVDVDEPLKPEQPHALTFPVRNPYGHPVTITLGLVPHVEGWGLALSRDVLSDMEPGEISEVTLAVTPPADLPPDGTPVVDVQAWVEREMIGGFRKIFRPPVLLHRFPDPVYAEREITVEPYPPRASEPTEICVDLRNPTSSGQTVAVQFAWAHFGIGLPFTPIDGLRPIYLPPYSVVKECIHWIPPVSGNLCLQVELFVEGYVPQRSRRNIDVGEPLEPLIPHALLFPVRNPFDHPVTITPGLIPHFPNWGLELSQDVLPAMGPGEIREVVLTVTPPTNLPADGDPVVDVEAYHEGKLVGGFRKIFRPPVPIHRPRDPVYAESEISVQPYPPRAGEPTEVCVELRNPTNYAQQTAVQFSWAPFGIGLPFTPINGLRPIYLPPHSVVKECIMWIPPIGGNLCLQVELFSDGHEPVWSQRNMDIGEPLEPLTSHARAFLVGNPFDHPVTITLGMIPHFPDWGLELSQDVLPAMGPAEVREVILTVTPPADLPADGDAIVDIEAFVDGELIGGFRKIFRPPVPIHRPRDPVYAESEIGVDPYPALPGQPTLLSVEVFNPTDTDRVVTATFSTADFGVGLPFNTADIVPNPIRLFVPKRGAARGHVIWTPPDWGGKFCVRVTLAIEGYEPIWSQRNIDVGEPLEPGVPHEMTFPVGGWPHTGPVTVSLGLRVHRDGWGVELSQDVLPNLQPGQLVPVTLTVTPPQDAVLGTGEPIVDVEGFVNGELIGGFRKLDRPPVPLHKPHEKGYAESEIIVDPYPPQEDVPTSVSTVVQNTSDTPVTVDLAFGWADFGIGIPFTTTGMVPPTRSVTLGPMMTETATVTWTPAWSGHQCIRILLHSEGYLPQESQRNVDVAERPPCGETKVFTFTVFNDTPLSVTVDIGTITFNVPADWQITVTPSQTLELEPWGQGVVKVEVTIPCPTTAQALQSQASINAMQQASDSIPTIDVEGYVEGELKGGIEIRFAEAAPDQRRVFLPVVLRSN